MGKNAKRSAFLALQRLSWAGGISTKETMGMNIIHVLPVNDLREHEEKTECWCSPQHEYVGAGEVVIHNSMDGRELYERGERLLN